MKIRERVILSTGVLCLLAGVANGQSAFSPIFDAVKARFEGSGQKVGEQRDERQEFVPPLSLSDLTQRGVSNDLCANATVVDELPFFGSVNTAQAGGDLPRGSCNHPLAPDMDNAVWYRWTAEADMTVVVGAVSEYDAIVAIYVGACGSLVEVSCGDSATIGGPDNIAFAATAGVTYTIQVGDWGRLPGGGDTGVYIYEIGTINDECTDALEIAAVPFSITQSTDQGATSTITNGNCSNCSNEIRGALWYEWTPTTACVATVSVDTGDRFPGELNIWRGTCDGGLVAVGCSSTIRGSDEFLRSRGFNSGPVVRSFAAAAGQTYFIQFGASCGFGNQAGLFDLTLTCSPLSNDACDDARVVTVNDIDRGEFFELRDLSAATADGPAGSCNDGSATVLQNSVWYSFTPTEPMFITFGYEAFNFDSETVLVYGATGSCASLSEVNCASGAGGGITQFVVSNAEVGTTYTFAAGIRGETPGGGAGNVALRTTLPNDGPCTARSLNNMPMPCVFTQDTRFATRQTGEGGCLGDFSQDVWYEWTAPSDGEITLELVDLTPHDMELQVWGGSDCSSRSLLACFDSPEPILETLKVSSGTTYFIRLGGALGGVSEFTFDFEPAPEPITNESCATAITINPGTNPVYFETTIDISTATADGPRASCDDIGGLMQNDVWYRYVPESVCALVVEVDPIDDFEPALFVWRGDSCESLSAVDCFVSLGGSAEVQVNSGLSTTPLYIQVGQAGVTPGGGLVTIRIRCRDIVPPTDTCQTSTTFTELPVSAAFNPSWLTGDAPNATCNTVGTTELENSVWLVWTADADGPLTFGVEDPNSSFNALLDVFTGTCDSLTPLLCVNSEIDNNEEVTFDTVAGTTYFFRAGVVGPEAAPSTVTANVYIERPTVVENETCATATLITALPFQGTEDTTSATGDGPSAQCDQSCGTSTVRTPSGIMPRDRWFTWTPESSCMATAGVLDSQGRPVSMNVWRGSCSPLTFVRCVSSGVAPNPARSVPFLDANFEALAGETYYFQIGSTCSDTGPRNLTFNLRCNPLPNDECDGATLLLCNTSTVVDLTFAQTEPNGPQISCREVDGVNSRWYSFQAASTTAIITTGAEFLDCTGDCYGPDTQLAVYSGSCGKLTEIACNDDIDDGIEDYLSQVTLTDLIVGGTYYIQVQAYDPDVVGVYSLTIECNPGCVTCPKGSTIEPEECGENLNGGDCFLPISSTVVEIPDAAQLLPGQNSVGNGTIFQITGAIAAGDLADLYRIRIDDTGSFSATTVSGAQFDTQLFLFDENGIGVTHNDDATLGDLGQSSITGQFVPAPGIYYLAISGFDSDPVGVPTEVRGGLSTIWLDPGFGEEIAPNGPAAGSPLAGWSNFGTPDANTGTYTITLSGASFAEQVAPRFGSITPGEVVCGTWYSDLVPTEASPAGGRGAAPQTIPFDVDVYEFTITEESEVYPFVQAQSPFVLALLPTFSVCSDLQDLLSGDNLVGGLFIGLGGCDAELLPFPSGPKVTLPAILPAGTYVVGLIPAPFIFDAFSGGDSEGSFITCGGPLDAYTIQILSVPTCCPGDANTSGRVNFDDMTTVLANFGNVYEGSTSQQLGDANCDGRVNFDDMTTVLANFGNVCGQVPAR